MLERKKSRKCVKSITWRQERFQIWLTFIALFNTRFGNINQIELGSLYIYTLNSLINENAQLAFFEKIRHTFNLSSNKQYEHFTYVSNNICMYIPTLTSLINGQALINGQDGKSTLPAVLAGRMEFSIYCMKISGQDGFVS